jgi:hypothetical protein
MWSKIRKALGYIADVFIFMRGKGWVQKGQDPMERHDKALRKKLKEVKRR